MQREDLGFLQAHCIRSCIIHRPLKVSKGRQNMKGQFLYFATTHAHTNFEHPIGCLSTNQDALNCCPLKRPCFCMSLLWKCLVVSSPQFTGIATAHCMLRHGLGEDWLSFMFKAFKHFFRIHPAMFTLELLKRRVCGLQE